MAYFRDKDPRIWIYVLGDPRDGEIRYIGQTSNLRRRLIEHLKMQNSFEMNKWICSLIKDGLKPIIFGIERVSSGRKSNSAERRWVRECLKSGCQLLNRKKMTGGEK